MHARTIHHRQQAERPRHFTRQRRIPGRKQNLCTDMFWLYMRQQIQNLLPDTGSCPAVSLICDFFFKFSKCTCPFFCSFLRNGPAVFFLLLRPYRMLFGIGFSVRSCLSCSRSLSLISYRMLSAAASDPDPEMERMPDLNPLSLLFDCRILWTIQRYVSETVHNCLLRKILIVVSETATKNIPVWKHPLSTLRRFDRI